MGFTDEALDARDDDDEDETEDALDEAGGS